MYDLTEYEIALDPLGLTDDLVDVIPSILADSNKFYRTFTIPKKRGGSRSLHAPYPSLRKIQGVILTRVLANVELHSCALAYRQGTNSIMHAARHVQNDELLLLDITDFFPSISRQLVYEALESIGLSSYQCNLYASLCCVNGGLAQGACTSPALSNLVFLPLDNRLARLATSLGLSYSRYADDLAFSGERVPRRLSRIVSKIIGSKGFKLNEGKTRLKVRNTKKIVTGVSISQKKLMVPRIFKRKLRAQIYELEKFAENISAIKNFDPLIYERTIGKINYLLQVEPDNEYALTKKAALSKRHQEFLSLAHR